MLQETITGRDEQIIREALSIAIPVMLRYSVAASNTEDMVRIVEALGGRHQVNMLNCRQFISQILRELADGDRVEGYWPSAYWENLVENYLRECSDSDFRQM